MGEIKSMERSGSRVSSVVRETGIDIKYGENTWRPVQSVIDLAQNHLDASTTVYEKRLLGLVGNTQYEPTNKAQQEVVFLLKKIKYSKEPDDSEQAYSALRNVLGGNMPDRKLLTESLKGIDYPLPRVRLRVTNGEESKFIDYNDLRNLPQDWEIVGFRIYDAGSGFDNKLLGIMGASTKKENVSKRGGLGEGLKMSVTHLVRSGATVRLLSRNEDQLWIARPQIKEGSVVFEGKQRKETDPAEKGSITDVDFGSPTFDAKARKEISSALDSRIGEGLGKFALEFRGEEFLPLIDNSVELTNHGVPRGRVYIKGLLVEEIDDLLFSYNLKDKFAIAGRDRKTVKREDLNALIKTTIESFDSVDQIANLLSLVSGNKNFMELQVLDSNLKLSDNKKELWKQAVAQAFNFTLGKDLFASSDLPSHQRRLALENGYHIVNISPKYMQAVSLFESLYGKGNVVSFEHFQWERIDRYAVSKNIFDTDRPLDSKAQAILDRFMNKFKDIISSSGYIWDNSRLRDLKFARRGDSSQFSFDLYGSLFYYNLGRNVLHVKDSGLIKNDFATRADMYVELLKTAMGKHVFDTVTQDLITRMAGKAVGDLRPELLKKFKFQPSSKDHIKFEAPVTYSQELREQDDALIAFYRLVEIVNTPNITKEKLEETLAQMRRSMPKQFATRKLGPSDLGDQSINYSIITNFESYFNRKLYVLDEKFNLIEFTASASNDTILDGGIDKQNVDFPSTPLRLPYRLEDGKSMRLTFFKGNQEMQVLVKRQGNRVFTVRTEDKGATQIVGKGLFSHYFYFGNLKCEIFNNFVRMQKFTIGGENEKVLIEKNERSTALQLEENNRGKDFISSNITLDYGAEVWRDPERILLDVLQNHIDAKKGELPNISYTVVGLEGKVLRVSKDDLKDLSKEWKVIGMNIKDNGDGYTTPYLTGLGKTTKGDEDLGKFGEGLKMLAASAVRQGIKIEIGSRDWVAIPIAYEQTVKDYETGKEQRFSMLGYKMKWLDGREQGSHTNFSVLELGEDQESLTLEQTVKLQEIFTQTSGIGNAWAEWTEVLDPRNSNEYGQRGLDRFVLPPQEKPRTNGAVTLLMDYPGRVFEKGLIIPGDAGKLMMFGYSIDEAIINTRERNTFNPEMLKAYLSDYFSNLTDTEVMEQILRTAKANPKSDFYEYQLLGSASTMTRVLWRQTYHKVFGDNAILSLQPELLAKQTEQRELGYDAYERLSVNMLESFVANESHLENNNLQILPAGLTSFFKDLVYSSEDFTNKLQEMEVELPKESKEKLFVHIQNINRVLLTILESIDSNLDRKRYLNKTISDDRYHNSLEERKENLLRVKPENIRIKNSSFPVSGMVEANQNGEAVISLNYKLLFDSREFLNTYIHEAAHYLSGQPDYAIGFQQFMMTLALSEER